MVASIESNSAQFGLALAPFAVLLFNPGKMSDRELGQRLQVVFHLLDVALDTANVFVGLETVELGDALDLDFGQADDILLGHFTAQAGFERIEPFVDRLQDTSHVVHSSIS